jgi:lipoprotein-releasing system permease protein
VFSRVERWVAWRYLRARRREGFISVVAGFSLVGIALGVATLIVVLSVMSGFREELLERLLGINGHVTVHPAASAQGIEGFDALATTLNTRADVRRATPQIQQQVMITNAGRARGALVRGVAPAELRKRSLNAEQMTDGALARFGTEDGVLVGDRLARTLGVQRGDSVTIVAPEGKATVFGTVPRARAYPVLGTFKLGMSEYDNLLVFMPLPQAQLHFQLPEMVNQIEVFVDNPDLAWLVSQEINADVLDAAYATPWQSNYQYLANALKVERNVMFLILTLIILIAAFNIISSLVMLVHDKGRGIAILRTMGSTQSTILRIFFLTGASIGAVGTLSGVMVGVALTLNIQTIQGWVESLFGQVFPPEIYYLTRLPAKIDSGEVVTIALISLGLSFLATVYPAWRAARLDPVEAVRYE